jgi:hypothetical protein
MFSSDTPPTPCVLGLSPGDESHRDVSAFMNQIVCVYIYGGNYMNNIPGKCNTHARIIRKPNPLPDNRQYRPTVQQYTVDYVRYGDQSNKTN